jgi:hypothetical protein
VFSTIARDGPEVLITLSETLTYVRPRHIAAVGLQHRIPMAIRAWRATSKLVGYVGVSDMRPRRTAVWGLSSGRCSRGAAGLFTRGAAVNVSVRH